MPVCPRWAVSGSGGIPGKGPDYLRQSILRKLLADEAAQGAIRLRMLHMLLLSRFPNGNTKTHLQYCHRGFRSVKRNWVAIEGRMCDVLEGMGGGWCSSPRPRSFSGQGSLP